MGDEVSSPKNSKEKEEQKQIGGLYSVFDKKGMEAQKQPDQYAKKGGIPNHEAIQIVIAKNKRKPKHAMKVKELEGLTLKEKNKAKFEDRALMCLGHPYIIQIYQAFTRENGHHHVVCELCETDFKTFLSDQWVENEQDNTQYYKKPSDDDLLTWFTQIAIALEETHSQELTHRNFDSTHMLRRKNEKTGAISAILSNFGNTRAQMVAAKTQATMTMGGDVYYTSPENLSELQSAISAPKLILGKKSDTWALGVFLVELCMGDRIFGIADEQGQLAAFSGHPKYKQTIADAKLQYPKLAHIIDAVLVEDKAKRLFASEILQLKDVKEKVLQLVTDKVFVTEYRELSLRKIKLGWARPGEVTRVQEMMKAAGKQKPEDVIDQYVEAYQRRVIEGGNLAIDHLDNKDITISPEDGEWAKKEERLTDKVGEDSD